MVASSPFDERSVPDQGDPKAYIQEIAEKKGESLIKEFPDKVIVTGDTVVVLHGKILLKPEDDQKGREMLETLSGTTHDVVSAVAVCKGKKKESGVETTRVHFNSLTKNGAQEEPASIPNFIGIFMDLLADFCFSF